MQARDSFCGLFEAAKKGEYAKRAEEAHNAYFQGIADAIQSRWIAGAPYLSSSTGLELLDHWADSIPGLAAALGNVFSCVECGGTVDLELAAKWYRKALEAPASDDGVPFDSDEIAYKLARVHAIGT